MLLLKPLSSKAKVGKPVLFTIHNASIKTSSEYEGVNAFYIFTIHNASIKTISLSSSAYKKGDLQYIMLLLKPMFFFILIIKIIHLQYIMLLLKRIATLAIWAYNTDLQYIMLLLKQY